MIFARCAVHAVYDGQALQLDALAADQLTALLEALFNGDADALHRSACLRSQLQQTHQGTAVGQKVVYDQDMVLRREELFGHDDVVHLFMGEGLDLGLVVIVVQVDAHGFFCKHHRHIQLAGHNSRNADAAGLDGQHLVDGFAGKQPLPLPCHLPEQGDIHLMIDKAVHLQHIALADDPVLYGYALPAVSWTLYSSKPVFFGCDLYFDKYNGFAPVLQCLFVLNFGWILHTFSACQHKKSQVSPP